MDDAIERQTERLLLTQWPQSHFDQYARIYADPELAKYIGGQMDRPKAWRHMAALVGHWAVRGFGIWAVEERQSGKFIGAIGLWYPEGWPELELGYWLVPEAYGKGFATEAGRASKEYAFDVMGAQTLVSYIEPTNKASINVAERLGGAFDQTIELLDLGPHAVYRYTGL